MLETGKHLKFLFAGRGNKQKQLHNKKKSEFYALGRNGVAWYQGRLTRGCVEIQTSTYQVNFT